MSQRVMHMFDQSSTGFGTIRQMTDGQAIVMVEWDQSKGKQHPCIRQELIWLDDGDRVRPKRVPRDRDRDDRGGRGRPDRD